MPDISLALVISHLTAWLTLRHVIVVLSILAAGVNITGIIPQLLTMLRARSSKGQSPLGWTLAATCSASLLFVNAVGYHAPVLATRNFVSLSGCLTAALVARHFRNRSCVAAEALQVLQDAPEALISELPAPELHALTESVLEEHHRRTGEAIPGEVVFELPAPDLQALTETVISEHQRRTGETIPEEMVIEMATHEFQALAEVVLDEHQRRTRRPSSRSRAPNAPRARVSVARY